LAVELTGRFSVLSVQRSFALFRIGLFGTRNVEEQAMPAKRKVKVEKGRARRARARSGHMSDDESLAEELIRGARKGHGDFVAGWKKFMKQLGIRGKPIGAKKLREMAIREGLDPNSTEFSRGIIEMREE
jgi:hypothetical protein